MYIYVIKYFNNIIAATDSDDKVAEVIEQYSRGNQMDSSAFKVETVRFFKENN